MQFCYCNNHLKRAYFELDSELNFETAESLAQRWLPYRVIGQHYIEIGAPIAIGLVARDKFGQIWLYPNDSRDGLWYINRDIDVLRDTCLRWSACRNSNDV